MGRMSNEHDLSVRYTHLIQESQRLAYRLKGDPDLLGMIAGQLIGGILEAITAGINHEEIAKAVEMGFHQGELQCRDQSLTPEYWTDIQQEAEILQKQRYSLMGEISKNK